MDPYMSGINDTMSGAALALRGGGLLGLLKFAFENATTDEDEELFKLYALRLEDVAGLA